VTDEGTVRKVDELGRVVLPVEFRRSLGLDPGDGVVMNLEGDHITVAPQHRKDVCSLCGGAHELFNHGSGAVCGKCARAVGKKASK